MRSKDAPTRPGYFGFFGGGVEKGETIEQAMLREVKEELDYHPCEYFYFQSYIHFGLLQHVFIMRADENFENEVRILEGEYGKFLTFEEVMSEKAVTASTRRVVADLNLHLQPKSDQ